MLISFALATFGGICLFPVGGFVVANWENLTLHLFAVSPSIPRFLTRSSSNLFDPAGPAITSMFSSYRVRILSMAFCPSSVVQFIRFGMFDFRLLLSFGVAPFFVVVLYFI